MSGATSDEALLPKDPESEKKKAEAAARRRYDFIVESDSFLEYPGALFWARITQVVLICSVVGCIAVLLATYFMGQLQIQRDIYKYTAIEAPSLVICPEYGGRFEDFELIGSTIGKLPATAEPSKELKHEVQYECMTHSLHCRCVDFPPGTMLKHFDDGIHFIKVEFKASSIGSENFIFGFNEPGSNDVQEVPHTFNMGLLHRSTMGHVSMREISEKMDKVWNAITKFDTRSVRAYDYETAGLAVPTESGNTELLFGFKTFFVPLDRSVSSMFSPFAILVLVVLCASYANNLNLYSVIFPVTEHPVFVQREPAPILRSLCSCLSCTKRYDHDHDADERRSTDLEAMKDDHHQQKMNKHPWGKAHINSSANLGSARSSAHLGK